MLHALEHLVLGGFIAFQFVRHQHSWNKALPPEQLAEKSLAAAGSAVASNVQHGL